TAAQAPVVARAAPASAAPALAAAQPTPAGPPIARFIDLENAFRRARTKEDLRLAMVNGARQLAPYAAALLLECAASPLKKAMRGEKPAWRAVAASDVAAVDTASPLARQVEQVVSTLAGLDREALSTCQQVDLAKEAGEPMLADLLRYCAAMPHMLWLPLRTPDGEMLGGFVAFQERPWNQTEITLLQGLASPYSHAWAALNNAGYDMRKRLDRWLGTARKIHVLPIILALAALAPVRFSALATAEIVGGQPMMIAAPLDGVVQDVLVSPGETVAAGQTLVSFVDTKLRNEVEVARKAHAVAWAKYQRAMHTVVANHRENQEVAIAKADADVAEAQLALTEDMLNRVKVVAPEAGVAIFTARADWMGRPVVTGERIMEIVDPAVVEVRIELPVADGIAFESGTTVKVFLDGQPLSAREATLSTMSYRPVANAENQMVYRLLATFAEGQTPPRLGARGTARIDGPFVPLGFYIFRRPLAALRQKLGL
ncbi:MAG: HlyD family efflux transporter periplasmic adaptor subunit, partial [Proteobacteria bacterium]|nr:HlyD family efflux transporter periplasmic adaptor subunit [Pseudomonadota bacterium]